jgi:subtilisin family serine protease
VAGLLTSSGERWSPSNGTSTSVAALNYLFAPGVNVDASTLVGSSGDDYNTAAMTGTSAAAAHISGVAALVQAANPALTARQIESILIASADPVTTTVSAPPPSYPIAIYWAG